MNLVFMGTPDFAVPCLKALVDSRHTVAMVVSQPDKPVGRKQIVLPTPVKALALEHGIEVFQPNRLSEPAVEHKLRELGADIFVVVAYGKILPASILSIPAMGCVNIHGSILPKYRGAAPIQRAVIAGDRVTGVCSMYMDEGMDTGDIISTVEVGVGENETYRGAAPIQRAVIAGDRVTGVCSMYMDEGMDTGDIISTVEVGVGENETSGEVFERLSQIGAQCLLDTLKKIEQGTVERIKQNDDLATYAPVLSKQEAVLNIALSAKTIHNHIRGMNPWPVARLTLASGAVLQIVSSRCADGSGKAGEVLSLNPLTVACGDGALELLEVKPEGRQKMRGDEFARGMRFSVGDIIFV